MGVDATMFIRIRERSLDTEDLQDISAELLQAFPQEFPIWPKGEKGLVLRFVRTLGDFRAELASETARWPEGTECFQEPPETLGKADNLHIWEQDGPPLVSLPDEQWIEVCLSSLFFGRDYYRGPWRELRAVAEWLEQRFPGGTVWYGGDSFGFVAFELTSELKLEFSKLHDALEERDRLIRE